MIVYLAVDGAGTQVASPDPKQQLAQAAASSPENPANKGPTCTAENDRVCNAMCAARTAEDPQHRKWVCDRAIIDQEGSICRYVCILAKQNACGNRERVEFFSPTHGRCWGCAGDDVVGARPPATSQLDEAVLDSILGNVGTWVSFRLGATDAAIMARQFAADRPEPRDLVNLANHETFVKLIIDGGQSQPFSAKTMATPIV